MTECPGPDCPYCNGEACRFCGAGQRGSYPLLEGKPPCEHDVCERHEEPAPTPA